MESEFIVFEISEFWMEIILYLYLCMVFYKWVKWKGDILYVIYNKKIMLVVTFIFVQSQIKNAANFWKKASLPYILERVKVYIKTFSSRDSLIQGQVRNLNSL